MGTCNSYDKPKRVLTKKSSDNIINHNEDEKENFKDQQHIKVKDRVKNDNIQDNENIKDNIQVIKPQCNLEVENVENKQKYQIKFNYDTQTTHHKLPILEENGNLVKLDNDILCYQEEKEFKDCEDNHLQEISNYKAFPFSCIGIVVSEYDKSKFFTTGTLISDNLVITSTSSIYNRIFDRFADKVTFYLSINSGYCSDSSVVIKHFCCSDFSKEKDNFNNSICILQLENNIGNWNGYIGISDNFDVENSKKFTIPSYHKDFSTNSINIFNYNVKKNFINLVDDKLEINSEFSVNGLIGSPLIVNKKNFSTITGIYMQKALDKHIFKYIDSTIFSEIKNFILNIDTDIRESK